MDATSAATNREAVGDGVTLGAGGGGLLQHLYDFLLDVIDEETQSISSRSAFAAASSSSSTSSYAASSFAASVRDAALAAACAGEESARVALKERGFQIVPSLVRDLLRLLTVGSDDGGDTGAGTDGDIRHGSRVGGACGGGGSGSGGGGGSGGGRHSDGLGEHVGGIGDEVSGCGQAARRPAIQGCSRLLRGGCWPIFNH